MNAMSCSLLRPSLAVARSGDLPWKPKTVFLFPAATQKPNPPRSIVRPPASAKGFGAPTAGETKEPPKKKVEEDDDLPESLLERISLRILFFVGVPMGIGFGFLSVFGTLMERKIVTIPLWVPFLTSLVFFGASTLGIAYGALSTSWDPERSAGSFIGWEEAKKNWDDVWREEEQSST